ncbi:MAG: bifunctional metallophosphatase/5'-nucleotidase [Myxococcota bacterium]
MRLQLLALNDFHGNLEPPAGGLALPDGAVPAGGVAWLAAHIEALRGRARNTLVVSAGDLIGASPLISALFHDEPTIEAMNLIGLDFNAVGNHELDEGLAELLRMKHGGCHPEAGAEACTTEFAGAEFDFLAGNVIGSDGKTIFPAFSVRSVQGVPVAFIGLTLENTAGILPAEAVPGLEFRDEAETANALVRSLESRGVRAIVLLLHEGGFPASRDPNACAGLSGPVVDILARLDPEIDLVLSGHTHQAYVCRRHGRLLTSAGSFGRLLTQIDVVLDPFTGDVVQASARNLVVHHREQPDPGLVRFVDDYARRAAPFADRVVARMRGALERTRNAAGASTLGRVIADAHLAATRSAGAELAFINGGGIRTSVAPVPGADGLGDITYGELFSAQPFGNLLVTLTLSGADIIDALQSQFRGSRPHFMDGSENLRYAWTVDGAGRSRVLPETVRLDGVALDPARNYRVTVNAYMSTRGVFARGQDRVNGGVDLDALVSFLAQASPLVPPQLGGVRRLRR